MGGSGYAGLSRGCSNPQSIGGYARLRAALSQVAEFSFPNTSVLGSDQDPCILQATTNDSDGCGWRLFTIIHTELN